MSLVTFENSRGLSCQDKSYKAASYLEETVFAGSTGGSLATLSFVRYKPVVNDLGAPQSSALKGKVLIDEYQG